MNHPYIREQLNSIAALGFNFFKEGKLDDAQIMFKGLIVADNSFYGWAGMGAIALAKEPPELEKAQMFLSIAVKRNPNDASVHTNLGEVYLRQQNVEQARAELQKALNLDPEKRDAGGNRARAILAGLNKLTVETPKVTAEA
jgi:tetratricopeptide (TPR) repeat protein